MMRNVGSGLGFVLAALILVGGACSSSVSGPTDGGAGKGGTTGSGGKGGTTGNAGSGGTGAAGTDGGAAGTGTDGGAAGTDGGTAGTGDASTEASTDGASAETSTDGASAETSTDGASAETSTDGGPSTAQATIAAFGAGTITGTAAFSKVATGVQVVITLANCPAGVHGIHIHAGTGCADTTAQGAHWGPERGEGIFAAGVDAGAGSTGEITCSAAGTATLTYTRTNAVANTTWTIGGDATTNIIGHPIVVHGLVGANREGCGVIQ